MKYPLKFNHLKKSGLLAERGLVSDNFYQPKNKATYIFIQCIFKGKTSIIAALLRLYPIDKGDVTIDNVNTSQISLKNLRRSIAVIPQDPVLFQGTLRQVNSHFNTYPLNNNTCPRK